VAEYIPYTKTMLATKGRQQQRESDEELKRAKVSTPYQ
jgi:hypothetical protein